MSKLDVLAETAKLARLLGTRPEQIEYLGKLDGASLRHLRETLSSSLFDETKSLFQRIVMASRLLPVSLLALIGEKVFGPMLCARVAGMLPADRALDVALKLPDDFLAEVSVELDPRSARELIARMPADRVVAVALLLVRDSHYITMGRFVGYLSEPVIRAAVNAITSDEALLRTAFFIESKDKLNDLIGMIPEPRLLSTILLAASPGAKLWTEALSLMDHANDHWKRHIGDLSASHDEAVLTGMLQAAQRLGAWDSVLPIVAVMSPASQRRVARLPALADRAVLSAVLQATEKNELWTRLLPLLEYVPEPVRVMFAAHAETLPDGALDRIMDAARTTGLWAGLITIVGHMGEHKQTELALRLAEQGPELIADLARAAQKDGFQPQLAAIAARMGAKAQAELAARVAALNGRA
jgi:hypothetical protein